MVKHEICKLRGCIRRAGQWIGRTAREALALKELVKHLVALMGIELAKWVLEYAWLLVEGLLRMM